MKRRTTKKKLDSSWTLVVWSLLWVGIIFCMVDTVYLFCYTASMHHYQPLDDVRYDKEPLIEILLQSGMKEVGDDVVRALPTWTRVTEIIGTTQPRLYFGGVDVMMEESTRSEKVCRTFRKRVGSLSEAFVAPAGAFNSGTNLMAELLIANCYNPARVQKHGPGNAGVRWQVNWGKHQPPQLRQIHSVNQDGKVPNENVLPIVTIRDPYTWMQSLCRNRYATHWFHVVPRHCPNLVPNHVEEHYYHIVSSYNGNKTKFRLDYADLHHKDPWLVDNMFDTANYTPGSKTVPVYVKYKLLTANHDSLAHMWNDWYHAYLDQRDFPFVMVRLEDLLFFGANVTERACACMGGKIRSFVHVSGSAKKGAIHGNDRTTLLDAMLKFNDPKRTKGMTQDDLDFAKQTLDPTLMKQFGYHHP